MRFQFNTKRITRWQKRFIKIFLVKVIQKYLETDFFLLLAVNILDKMKHKIFPCKDVCARIAFFKDPPGLTDAK